MEFPLLISGELVQSSAVRSDSAQHREYFFEGYSRQAQRHTSVDQRLWRLNYANLSPAEAMRLRAFFEALPVDGEFSFTDPWTTTVYPNCRLASPALSLTCDKDNRYTAQLEIENAG